ncbi:10609_t:CDS:2 [Ambispora leptoticha]|uniref:10609_t:CDS:1 n=1 Tax=Ambispora leptoticha TaxID=144679 RepID=A0A9N8VXA5_9GLOM|nr:10609_t:CDS:2 [Ambispora leptoticha]
MKDIFEKFPHEIIAKILSFLNGIDLYSISLVNKNLLTHTRDDLVWKFACQNEFSSAIINEWNSTLTKDAECVRWQTLYNKLRTSLSYFGEDEKCVSSNIQASRYRFVQDEESRFGKVLHLQNIWSFEINTNITRSIAPGKYDILIRMKCEKEHQGLGGLIFCTELLDRKKNLKETYTCSPRNHTYQTCASRDVWVELMLSYVIKIPEKKNNTGKRYSLSFSIFEEKKYIKAGLWLDYVRYRPHVDIKYPNPYIDKPIWPGALIFDMVSIGATSSARQARRIRGKLW